MNEPMKLETNLMRIPAPWSQGQPTCFSAHAQAQPQAPSPAPQEQLKGRARVIAAFEKERMAQSTKCFSANGRFAAASGKASAHGPVSDECYEEDWREF